MHVHANFHSHRLNSVGADNSVVLVSMNWGNINSIRTLDSTEDGNNCGCLFWSVLAIDDLPQWVHELIRQSFSVLGGKAGHTRIYVLV
ncbi:hypothetical protein TNCV_4480251 [Trichonephila clavipes]|nr:hypothetical protein TNCV_4480251 [Trichonephila clavipes]